MSSYQLLFLFGEWGNSCEENSKIKYKNLFLWSVYSRQGKETKNKKRKISKIGNMLGVAKDDNCTGKGVSKDWGYNFS